MKRNLFLGSLVLLFLLIVASYSIFFSAQRPMMKAESEAVSIAQEVAAIRDADDFYWYNGTKDTYFTVAGWDDEGNYLYVIIKQNGGDTMVLDAREVITEDEAKSITQSEKSPERILEARMGIMDEMPFWEISYKKEDGSLAYLLISAQTGETMKEYANL